MEGAKLSRMINNSSCKDYSNVRSTYLENNKYTTLIMIV